MKEYKLLLLLIFLLSSAYGQQIVVPSDQYHLYGPNSTWGAYLHIGGNGRTTTEASVVATNGNLHLDSKVSFATYINHYSLGNTYINSQGGSVGIGTANPIEKFDVMGNCRLERVRTGNAVFYGNSRNSLNSFNSGKDPSVSNGWIAADFGGADNASDRLVVGTGFGGKSVIGTHNYNLTQWGGALLINPLGGDVGIGTSNPTEKLSVNGKIRAKEIKVETENWPDYVFEASYNPASLPNLEKFIKVNKHLPEIPSAQEIEENGVSLGEMNAKLLEKIEELTLYLIEQNKRNEEQDKKITEQQKEIETLKDLNLERIFITKYNIKTELM